ncbi:DUF1878 family protein [Halobacillus fulvus]|nr:DUF1878 family protein [Halobacillus fulvus]
MTCELAWRGSETSIMKVDGRGIVNADQHQHSTEFHIRLLMEIEEMDHYPFHKMIVRHKLTEKEYQETLALLEELNTTYEEDEREGLLDHSGLLIHFAGMLSVKLPIEETIQALYEQRLYPALIQVLRKYIRK